MAYLGGGQDADHAPVGPARFVSELINLLDNPEFEVRETPSRTQAVTTRIVSPTKSLQAISWTADGRQFHLDVSATEGFLVDSRVHLALELCSQKVGFVAPGGGMSEICDSEDINSFIRQLRTFKCCLQLRCALDF